MAREAAPANRPWRAVLSIVALGSPTPAHFLYNLWSFDPVICCLIIAGVRPQRMRLRVKVRFLLTVKKKLYFAHSSRCSQNTKYRQFYLTIILYRFFLTNYCSESKATHLQDIEFFVYKCKHDKWIQVSSLFSKGLILYCKCIVPK